MSTTSELVATAYGQLQAGQLSQAIDTCHKALAIEHTAPACNVLVIALVKAGNLPDAIEAAKAATRLEPSNATHWLNLAVTFNMAGRLEEALAAVWHGLKAYPTHFALWYERAKLFTKTGRIDDAIKIAIELQESQPNDPRGFGVGGIAYMKAGRAEESQACFARELELRQTQTQEAMPPQSSHITITNSIGEMVLPVDFEKNDSANLEAN